MLFGKCLKLRGAGLNRPVMLIYFICGQCIPETGRFSESGIWIFCQSHGVIHYKVP